MSPQAETPIQWPGQTKLRRQMDRNRPEIIHSVSNAAREILRTEIKMEIAAKNKMAEATMANRLPPKASKTDNAAIAATNRTVIIIMASRLRLEITASAAHAAATSNRRIIICRGNKIIPANPEKTASSKADKTAARATRIVCGNLPSGWDRIIIALKTMAARSPETVL